MYWPQQQDPFLDDQIVAVKYVYINEDRNPGRTQNDLQSMQNSFTVSIRHLRDFNRELAHYHFKLRDKISVLRAAAEDLYEAAPSHRNWAARNQISSKKSCGLRNGVHAKCSNFESFVGSIV